MSDICPICGQYISSSTAGVIPHQCTCARVSNKSSLPNSSPLLICDAADRCTYPDKCYHRRSHISNYGESCGPGMECYEAKILSRCVPVVGRDHYYTTERVDCPHCNGRGHDMVQVMHRIPKEQTHE